MAAQTTVRNPKVGSSIQSAFFTRAIRIWMSSWARVHFDAEPAAGVSPVIVGGGGGDSQRAGGLFDGKARKETQLNQLGLARVVLFQFLKDVVEGQQIDRRFQGGRCDVGNVLPLSIPPGLEAPLVASALD